MTTARRCPLRPVVPLLLCAAAVVAGCRSSRPAGEKGDEPASPRVRVGADSFRTDFPGLARGTHRLELSPAPDGGYRYHEVAELGPAWRRDIEAELGPDLSARHVRVTMTQANQTSGAELRYAGRRAVGRVTVPGEGGPREIAVDTALPDGAFDGSVLLAVIPTRPWRVGLVDTLRIFDTDEMSVTAQTLRVVGEEELTVPAGTFPAYRGELSTTQLPVTVWVTRAAPHRILKLASANGQTVLLP